MENEHKDKEEGNRILCYLFYGGAVIDIILNYGLILCYTILIFYPFFISFQIWRKIVESLLFMLIQVVIWICLDVCGVSLIWSGQLGLIIYCFISTLTKKFRRHNNVETHDKSIENHDNGDQDDRKNYLRMIAKLAGIFLGLAVLIYYAITLPPITTIAHVSAIILGLLITLIMSCFKNCKKLLKKTR